jgi:PAS domain S-box-containing protein
MTGRTHRPRPAARPRGAPALAVGALERPPRAPKVEKPTPAIVPPAVPAADFRLLFEAAPVPFLVLDRDLTIVAASDAYLAASMTVREQIVGRGVFEVFPDNPADPGATGTTNLRASLDRVLAWRVPDTMAVQRYDIRRPEADGGGFEERFWSPVNSPILDERGRVAYIVHRVEDVTEFVRLRNLATATGELGSRTLEMEADIYARAQDIAGANRQLNAANLELRRSEAFLDSVIENIPAMVFVKDARTLRFVRLNRAGEALLGISRADYVGRTDHDFFPREEADFFTDKDREVIARGAVVDIPEEPIETPSGRRILHTKKLPVVDEDGLPIYLLGISEDITDRKHAEDAIQAARVEAERANRAKTEFLSRMSHELRTPLNAILGFSQLLEMDELSADQRENVAYISQAGRHLLELINEVLDISRIESGQISISREPVAVEEVLHEVTALVRPLADARRVALDIRAAQPGVFVLADRQRLNQVLLNLLSNAVKYNRDGGSIRVETQAAADGMLRISIADTGYGIAPEHRDRLFRPFDRLGAERSSVEGTGMGLALSKGLVEAMAGSIGVDSTVDVGTLFWIELALAESQLARYERTTDSGAGVPAGPTSLVILQIDDNASNVRLVERIVSRRPGTELLSAAQGQLGLELARRHRPGLILLDLHLPDMAGDEVLRRLRADPATRDLPVVVLSANAEGGRHERLMKAGAFGYLDKPLDVGDFLAIVDRLAASGTAAE